MDSKSPVEPNRDGDKKDESSKIKESKTLTKETNTRSPPLNMEKSVKAGNPSSVQKEATEKSSVKSQSEVVPSKPARSPGNGSHKQSPPPVEPQSTAGKQQAGNKTPTGAQSGQANNLRSNEPATPSNSTSAINSEVSLGFGEVVAEEDRTQTLVIRDGPEPYKSILRTVCSYGIRCSHGKIPIQKLRDHQGYFLPYVYACENSKYLDTVYQLYDNFLCDSKNEENAIKTEMDEKLLKKKANITFLSNIQLYSIYRFQIPDGQFISRFIFLAQWSVQDSSVPDAQKVVCCKDSANIQWHSMEAILQEIKQDNSARQLMDRFWGYEIVLASTILQQQHQGNFSTFTTPQMQECNSTEVLKYLSKGGSSRGSSASFASLLHDAKFTEKDVIKIYCDYVQHCFPSSSMTYCSFFEYFTKIGFLQFDDTSLRNIFRAMNFKNKHFILFNEFLLGLAALDSNVPNCKLRFTYIFRYYDTNADGFLDEDDFRRMITDIRYKANLSCDPAEINNDVKQRLSTLKLMDNSKRINFKSFLNEANQITGIIHLFRTNKAILDAIHTRHAYEMIINKNGKPFGTKLIGTCPKCRPKKYSLAYHTVKLNAQGRIDDPKALVKLNCGEIDAKLQFEQKADEMELKHSREVVFNENSVANKVLNIVRKMQDFNKLTRDRQKEVAQTVVGQLTPQAIVQLCKEVTDILLIEPRVLKVNTPCIVIGDLHGNINDLLTYEEQLWPLAPCANSPNLLFLGDYVDRGDYSIEVISYLFAMKILAPTKFFLLRGNHEIRTIQRNFTFFKECVMKYASKDGQLVFDSFNNAFDHLPLVGIIDESIFCAHGGIPYSVSKIEDLYKIPMPLFDPEMQSKAAWEVLWSDPITDDEYREVCQFHNQSNDSGFADNIRRSTAYYFTEKALRNFLKANSLSHVIRAHELEIDGYRFHHSGLLITVFSSSRYCNSLNRSAAVFVDSRENDGFIKVIALDT